MRWVWGPGTRCWVRRTTWPIPGNTGGTRWIPAPDTIAITVTCRCAIGWISVATVIIVPMVITILHRICLVGSVWLARNPSVIFSAFNAVSCNGKHNRTVLCLHGVFLKGGVGLAQKPHRITRNKLIFLTQT